ncbi:MAG: hypothetical protein LUC87_11195 [Clostridiales bacterium]|nr:hypothetical protein [Clostridiales bacterium]MCD8368159.1 hypothetical protein [Clostridiales bacterium]
MVYQIPELTEAENKLPVAKYYYNYPLHGPNPLYSQLLDLGAMSPEDALPLDRCFDLLRPEGYDKVEYGYCMMPDGSGYIANYSVLSDSVTPEMRMWYVKWLNIHSKHLPEGVGNIRYKLWNQVDHIDHGLVDGDFKKGIYTLETLDMGRGSEAIRSIRHNFDVRDYGFPEDKYQALVDAHIGITSCWESFDCPGSHLVLSVTRPCPLGGVETLSREWIGYKAENGKFVRDPETPDFMLCEQYLRDVQIHNTVEQQHLSTFLPELYAEYHDKPMDAD